MDLSGTLNCKRLGFLKNEIFQEQEDPLNLNRPRTRLIQLQGNEANAKKSICNFCFLFTHG